MPQHLFPPLIHRLIHLTPRHNLHNSLQKIHSQLHMLLPLPPMLHVFKEPKPLLTTLPHNPLLQISLLLPIINTVPQESPLRKLDLLEESKHPRKKDLSHLWEILKPPPEPPFAHIGSFEFSKTDCYCIACVIIGIIAFACAIATLAAYPCPIN